MKVQFEMFTRTVLLLLALAAALPLQAQVERYVEGVHYRVLPDNGYRNGIAANSGKADVLEVFWYGCPSCAALDPLLNAWAGRLTDTVQFSRSPAVWNDNTRTHARLFFAARELGIGSSVHEPAFTAIHRERNYLLDDAAITALFVAHGAEASAVHTALKSFAVDTALRKAEGWQREWRIANVPALIVDGRYLVSGTEALSGYEDMLKVTEFLVEKTLRQAR